jgi:hypothetical protein
VPAVTAATSGRLRAVARAGTGLTLVATLAFMVTRSGPAEAHPHAATLAPAWVVSLGDSYLSGEGGRWAGNANDPGDTDALGQPAYWDTPTGESEPGCHRSKSAEIVIGSVSSLNLACSGSSTGTEPYRRGHDFKPGLDFYDDGAGHLGQAAALQQFAGDHRVTMVAVSIGGNDFNFGRMVDDCVRDFLLSPSWWKDFCHDDSEARDPFRPDRVATVQDEISTALQNVRRAMADAGYPDDAYSVVVQTYPAPLAPGHDIRYSEVGPARALVGGCGFWNADANWANTTAGPTINATVRAAVTSSGLRNAVILDVAALFLGHRLCERGVQKVQDIDGGSWRAPGAADHSEWVSNIRTITTLHGPYDSAESLHPNYWGQLALRGCLRQAYDGGHVRGGTCTTAGPGLTPSGEPRVQLATVPPPS